MKKTYIQPTMKVVEVNPRTILLTGSPWDEDDTAGFNDEPQDPTKFY